MNRKRSDVDLKSKALKIAMDPKVNEYHRGSASAVYKFFNERTKGLGLKNSLSNEILANELHKPIIKNFKRRKVYSSFKDNIWDVDLADMSLISKFNEGIKYLLCIIDLFSRYSWVIPLGKKVIVLLKDLKVF